MSASTPSSEPRIVHCKKLGKDLPGLSRQPYKNDLGKRIYEEISRDAWDMWLRDSVKYINTYRVDLTSAEGQKFMFKQCAIYFGFEDGAMAETAFVPKGDEKEEVEESKSTPPDPARHQTKE
jgi:Fe-S cluster biosynthesis and repair protein YggX